jgi:hypothetical protein
MRKRRRSNPFSFLFARSGREQHLAQYVIRESGRGRPLAEVLDDAYVVNRWTPEERARLVERPEVVAALGERALDELKTLAGTRPPVRT